jgi:GDPmannose 4,6-dehydratase
MKTALITGISGQDGYHLTNLLLEKNYNVVGTVRTQDSQNTLRFKRLFPGVKLLNADLGEFSSLLAALQTAQPDEIYNLGGESFVSQSFLEPEQSANINGLGILRMLEAIRLLGLTSTRIYQAGSSEMFGRVSNTPQNEATPLFPQSPYGVAKTFAHHTCINYRERHGMFICSGIMYNHEGEYRDHKYVTRKITSSIARIKLGRQDKFELGSLSSKRDWGYAADYVEAMWRMLQQEIPKDYVVATGKLHSVRDFVEVAIEAAGLKGHVEDYVVYNPAFQRPKEVCDLVGDPTRAKLELGWAPVTDFNAMVDLMIENDLILEDL